MKPLIIKIVWNDWPALFAVVSLPILVILYFIHPFVLSKPETKGFIQVFLLILSIPVFALLFWRIGRVKSLFRTNVTVPGIIEDLFIVKDRGRLEFSYVIGSKKINSWAPVHETKHVISMSSGMEVNVLYDPKKPSRAIIRELFI